MCIFPINFNLKTIILTFLRCKIFVFRFWATHLFYFIFLTYYFQIILRYFCNMLILKNLIWEKRSLLHLWSWQFEKISSNFIENIWHTKNKFANNEFLKYDTLCIEEREKKFKMKLIIRILVFSSNDICYILIKHAYLHWTLYHAIFKFVNA